MGEGLIKKCNILILFVVIVGWLAADYTIDYKGRMSPEIIKTEALYDYEYFNVFELNKSFRATIKNDALDMRIKVNLYDEQIILLLNTSYLMYKNEIYNMDYPLLSISGRAMLPISFIERVLPKIFPDKIDCSEHSVIAEVPIDHRIRKIVIDPGHGGKDPGAIGKTGRNYEKTFTLKVAKKLKERLEKDLDVEVILTRDSDEFVSLQDRTKLANEREADLFISIHFNAHNSSKANGIEVYYLSTAKTDEARAVEALENSVVYDFEGGEDAVKRYNDLAFILADMAQSEHLEESYQQALKIQNYLIYETGARDRGVKQANFYVLRGAFMPAVLLELGYITNKTEETKIVKDSYQEKLASAIFKGIKDFKYKYDQMQ